MSGCRLHFQKAGSLSCSPGSSFRLPNLLTFSDTWEHSWKNAVKKTHINNNTLPYNPTCYVYDNSLLVCVSIVIQCGSIVIFKLGSCFCRPALINAFTISWQNITLSISWIHSAWYNFTYCTYYWAEYFCWFTYNSKCPSFQGHHQCFYILIASVLLLAHCDFMSKTACPIGHAEKMFHYGRWTEYTQLISHGNKKAVWSHFPPFFLLTALSFCMCGSACMPVPLCIRVYSYYPRQLLTNSALLSVYETTMEHRWPQRSTAYRWESEAQKKWKPDFLNFRTNFEWGTDTQRATV